MASQTIYKQFIPRTFRSFTTSQSVAHVEIRRTLALLVIAHIKKRWRIACHSSYS